MSETITINDVTYKIDKNDDKIHLQRFNDKHNMWVNLYFPQNVPADNDSIIETLSKLYIEKNIFKEA